MIDLRVFEHTARGETVRQGYKKFFSYIFEFQTRRERKGRL